MDKKVQLLRELMEKYDLFQQDDEVGQALKELETEVDSYKGWELYREDFSENSEEYKELFNNGQLDRKHIIYKD